MRPERAYSILRRYLVATALVAVLVHTVWGVFFGEARPVGVHPPDGYLSPRNFVQLEWSEGETSGAVTVQVAAGKPDFEGELLLDKKVSAGKQSLDKLDRGQSYFWRVLPEDGEPGRVMMFETTRDAIRYR